MGQRFFGLWLASTLVLGGCSLHFDRFRVVKTDAGRGGHDGGKPSGSEAGALPPDGGKSDAGLDGGADGGGTLGDRCTTAADCGSPNAYVCTAGKCAPRRAPSSVWQSGGGGVTKSSNFELRLSVGAPVPFGPMRSEHYEITVGPGAGRN